MNPAPLFTDTAPMDNLTSYLQSTQQPCHVQTHEYAMALMKIWIRRNWPWAFALPILAVAAAAATMSIRYLLIAVVLACLVFPHIIVLIYYSHAMSPHIRMSILPHTVNVSENGITLTYIPQQEQQTVPAPDHIPSGLIKKITYTGTLTIIHLNTGRYNIIALPRHMPQQQ
ncbi:hypothetical protein [uncultured Muribaculum sp.]|uniref:hypothetical protein n=1 Tax=uncultured Muribaculum sp. TaxID=1918613 RepID=UPI0025878435|nr:hypothetical protein [uncultured Muribaculum sp.]